jgi:ribosomal protein S18 acetylase RimI-like enzyme
MGASVVSAGLCSLRRVARDALHLLKAWVTAGPSAAALPGQVRIRPLSNADEPALGRLMWLAFQGNADDEYTAPGDAEADGAGTLAGRWGPVVWQASLAAELDSAIVSAVIVVLDDAHHGLPLLAFAMVDPACQCRGIGRWLIEESMRRLDAIGVKELHLAVTRGNPPSRCISGSDSRSCRAGRTPRPRAGTRDHGRGGSGAGRTGRRLLRLAPARPPRPRAGAGHAPPGIGNGRAAGRLHAPGQADTILAMRGKRGGQAGQRGPRLLISMTERELRKRHMLADGDKIAEWKQGKIERWWVEGAPQPQPQAFSKLDVPQLRGLSSCSYSSQRLFFGSAGLAVDLEFMWQAEGSSKVLHVVFSSPQLTAVRWRSDEVENAEALAGFASRIRAQRERRLADLPAESRQRAADWLSQLERSGALASALTEARTPLG